jgi:RND family efflux transporter MFP subunit
LEWRVLTLGAAGWLSLAGLSGCAEQQEPVEILRPVRTQTVTASSGSRERTFAGTSRAGLETDLSFRVSGRVEEVRVTVGDAVRAGEILARLEPRDYELAVAQAQASLAQAQATQRNAEADLERVRGLWENNNASQNELDGAMAQAQSTRAQVDGAVQALESAQRRLSYTELRSPVNGSIASVPVEVNENVDAGKTVVMLTSGARAEVEVAIPGVLIAQIRDGDTVGVTFDALPGSTFPAVVTEVGVAATGAATTFPVTVRLDRESGDVRSGMAANVTFRFAATDDRDRFYLPSHAVGGDRAGRFVFLLEPSGEDGVGKVRRVEVEVGELTRDGLEIVSGLLEGQEVVTAGVRRLTDGQSVRLLPAGSSR